MLAHRKIGVHMKRQLEANDIAIIRPSKNIHLCEVQITTSRWNFFHLIDIDDEGRLRNILWIHPRSRAAYKYFHDVVSFDTIYLVNRYEMPFGAFVGINHHGKSILLGCALLTQETIDSFKWLFKNWIEAMGGVHPKAIITDQCDNIKGAVRDVLQNTFPRYFLWHIMSKLPKRFKGLAQYHMTVLEFKGIVYDSITIPNFDIR
ncbi:hypothetical protein ACS0TY_034028 [Phlomoides rotata]